MQSNLSIYYKLFALGLIILLICPSLIQDGMFMDGQQYACVAKNLSEGYGTWWFPYLSDSWWKAGSGHFMEHPPLVYWLQAGFFKVFGDGMYTERIYSFVTALITAFLIHKTWRLAFKSKPDIQKLSMLPVVCWIIIPVGFWSYQHNMQENTMAIFSLLSIYCFLVAMEKKGPKIIAWLTYSSLCIALAFLCKGPPGLFPLAALPIYFLSHRNITLGWMLMNLFIVLNVVICFFLIITIIPAAYESLEFYVKERLLYRIESEPVVSNRFSILIRLLMELLPAIGLVAVSIIVSAALKLKPEKIFPLKNEIFFFILVGLSASLPLMLTPVQRGFYLVPAFPFFGLGLAAIAAPYLLQLKNNWSRKKHFPVFFKSLTTALMLVAITLTVLNIGKSRRDGEMIQDIHIMSTVLQERGTIGASPMAFEQWNLQFYFMRYYGISMCPMLDDCEFDYIVAENGWIYPKEWGTGPALNDSTTQFDLLQYKPIHIDY